MSGVPARPGLPQNLAALLVFVASGAVLVLELLGVRLLAPYVGLTLETYTPGGQQPPAASHQPTGNGVL